MNKDLQEIRYFERLCVEQAELTSLELARIGLLKVADDCRAAAEAIESRRPGHLGPIAGVMQTLKLSLGHGRASKPH
jgi:hypothetical protein